jgi:glycosyltransferase involved in cell wall biosynthesis
VADEAICTNEYQRRRLIGAGAKPERVSIVWNGPVLERVLRAVPDESLKGDASFLCCWLGKMGRQDRVDLALLAIKHLVEDLGEKDVRFAFLGNGECLDEARELSSELGLDAWVTFTGWVPESTVFSYLATADLGIDASLQGDVSPVKIFEYMAFGVPFACFDLPETTAIGSEAGVFVAPGDVPALARELQRLLVDTGRRTEMGRVGIERIHEELAWEHQAETYLSVIRSLIARSASGRRGRSTGAVAARARAR